MRIGIIGAGSVGGTLGRRWGEYGHEVFFGVRDPADPKVRELIAKCGRSARAGGVGEVAGFGTVVVLATPWSAAERALRSAGDLSGRTLLDCTNPLTADLSGLTVGLTKIGRAHV